MSKLIFCEHENVILEFLEEVGGDAVIIPRDTNISEKTALFDNAVKDESLGAIIVMDHWFLSCDHHEVDDLYYLDCVGNLFKLQELTDKELRPIHNIAKLTYNWWRQVDNKEGVKNFRI